jgi:hypothetical protein
MAGTTTNNAWTYPTSTDLVKDGASAIQTLATGIDTSTGKGLIAWQTWAPTLSSGWANGNGVWDAKYCQIGKTVHVRASFSVGTTTTKGTSCIMSLPVTSSASTIALAVGFATIGGLQYCINSITNSTTSLQLVGINTSATYGYFAAFQAAVPATWATGNIIYLSFTYEAA